MRRSVRIIPPAAALFALACAVVGSTARAEESATCRELQRKFDLIKRDMVSVQLNSMLFAAADAGCGDFAQRLLATGASLAARDRLGAMPLTHAARAGQRAVVGLLLAKGAQINERDLSGSTALYRAAEGERQATLALLLDKGADPNLPGQSGVTPLAAAAFRGNDRIVEQLLSHGSDPRSADTTGKTAITYAAARGFADIVQRLLDAGVDPKERYGHGLTALIWAAGHDDEVGAQASQAVIGLLLDHGAGIDAADDRGRTALMTAAELGHAEAIETLLARGADRTLRDMDGKTALDLATNDGVRGQLASH